MAPLRVIVAGLEEAELWTDSAKAPWTSTSVGGMMSRLAGMGRDAEAVRRALRR